MSNFTMSHAAPDHDLQEMLHCQIQTLRLEFSSRKSPHMYPIENLWRKVTLEIVKRHPKIKHKLTESLTAACKGLMTRPRAAELASRQPGRKINAAKPPPNIRLKTALPRGVNEKLAITV